MNSSAIAAAPAPVPWVVTVTEGPQIGLVGWSLAGTLADKKVP